MPPNTPQGSVVRQRNRAVADTTARMSDYDRKNMEAYGFIYADGTYSDERQPRGATIVPRRPSINHAWDPDTREWYEVHENEAKETFGEGRRFLNTADGAAGVGTILPDRAAGGPAPLVGLDAEKQALIDRLQEIEELEAGLGAPTPPKTDIYPTHSVAHSVRGVVSSNDPAAAPNRPESVTFLGAGPAPTQDEVMRQMQADAQAARLRAAGGEGTAISGEATRVEEANRGIHNTGDQEAKSVGGIAQQGASNTTRGVPTPGRAEGANVGGAAATNANMSPQPQVNADTAKGAPQTSPGQASGGTVPKL